MKSLAHLFENNRRWAEQAEQARPGFFEQLARQQSPKYLWIGCSDSRVPANQITGLESGELFVHRNVGNQVVHSDFNALSVIQFAVDYLKVEHIIVCGHYGCGGVQAALDPNPHGLVDNWLRHIRDIHARHRTELSKLEGNNQIRRLCELNVLQSVVNVCSTTLVQDAWSRGQSLTVHGWIYSLRNGLLKDMGLHASAPMDVEAAYRMEF